MLSLSPLFGNNAVLQCEQPIPVWGTARPNASVAVHLGDHSVTTLSDATGSWQVRLPSLTAGGPYVLSVTSDYISLDCHGIMLGEVWLCSGQSNMEWTLGMLQDGDLDAASAHDPLLRCFTVRRSHALTPVTTLQGEWRITDPETVRSFSATAYGFARRLRAETGRPVGVVVAAFGGTAISAWLPASVWDNRADYAGLREEWAKTAAAPTPMKLNPHPFQLRSPSTAGWEMSAFDHSDWSTLNVPGFWQDQGWKFNGAIWYRRSVELPERWRGQALLLEFGACDDFDETFVNGERVGGIGPELTTAYNTRREYLISPSQTRDGKLTITVRIFDQWGNGGIIKRALLQHSADQNDRISLAGAWKAQVEAELPFRLPPAGTACPPTTLYNGMIHPVAGLGVRGVLWYQGESDAKRAALYPLLLADLIGAWRKAWGNPQLPFGIVQLANYFVPQPRPVDSEWAEIRQAQLTVAQTTPATGLIVAIDLGEPDNLHPPRKGAVGDRLAFWALAQVYRQSSDVPRSPLPIKSWIEGDAIYVRFEHVGNGLRTRDGAFLKGFQIAAADCKWCWAEASIVEPTTVRVRADGITLPAAIRYAWQDNPVCTLENSSGLPASPFRTDDWPLSTAR